MRIQGLASYNVCGVQGRMPSVYAHGRASSHFVRMTQYAFCTYSEEPRPRRRLVTRAIAHGDRADPGLCPHARAHLLRGLCDPRALRGGEPWRLVRERLRGLPGRLPRLLDRAPGALWPVARLPRPETVVAGRQLSLRRVVAARRGTRHSSAFPYSGPLSYL